MDVLISTTDPYHTAAAMIVCHQECFVGEVNYFIINSMGVYDSHSLLMMP